MRHITALMLLNHTDYRIYLKSLLTDACSKNPQFSMRAMARKLDISPSNLSRILNSKRKLTAQMAARISTMLNHGEKERSYLSDLVLLDGSESEMVKQSIIKRIEKRRSLKDPISLDMNKFKVISEWYHYAILALTQVKEFHWDVKWISKRLAITEMQAKLALERLESVGLIQRTEENINVVNREITTTNNISSLAIRDHHKQMISKALKSVDEQAVEERDLSSVTVSFKCSDMDKARDMIKEFRRKFNTEIDEAGGDELYQLNIQFFQLSKKEKTK